MSKSKQMRVSETQYNTLTELSEEFGVSRNEMLNSVIRIIEILANTNATAVKVVCGSGEIRELILAFKLGKSDES